MKNRDMHLFEGSTFGLGCMGMTGFYGAVDQKRCIQAIHTAIENGINFLDTADNYGFGENESLVGLAIAAYRNKVFIATKVGVVCDKTKPHLVSMNGSPNYIKQQCVSSLKRLGVSVIDLYYLHHQDHRIPIEETIGAMAELVAAGFVRHIGLGEMDVETIRRAHTVYPITAIQAEYSIFSRKAEEQILPICKELGIRFVACSPICRGLLSGKITAFQDLTPGDFRQQFPRFQEENLRHNLAIVRSLENIANEIGCSLSQASLAWVASQSLIPLFGTTSPAHVIENVKSRHILLEAETIDKINSIVNKGVVFGDRHPEMMKKFYPK